MKISGLQKMTLLDFPGKVACTVFLQGCNFRCPFCHNSGLLGAGEDAFMTTDEFITFLNKRTGLLDAVCVSGGEPTLSAELPQLLRRIKALGFATKLDTNGSRPEVLKALVEEGLIDYVAMDVKNSFGAYPATTGCAPDMAAVEESLRYLLQDHVAYELRTTIVAELHSEESIAEMGKWLCALVPNKKPLKLFLQAFVDRDSVLQSGLTSPDERTLKTYLSILSPYIEQIAIRGV